MSNKESKVGGNNNYHSIHDEIFKNLNEKSKHKKRNITFYLSEDKIDILAMFCEKNNLSKSIVIETLIEIIENSDDQKLSD